MKTVKKTSIFPASKKKVFSRLLKLKTLQYIAYPYATFTPMDGAWNHEIILEELQGNRCRYTDKVDIDAGWKTIFVWMWANCFYTHRQKKWIKLLSRKI